eukprot:scaffold7232_cov310-Ochromonas_danica.AAC.9
MVQLHDTVQQSCKILILIVDFQSQAHALDRSDQIRSDQITDARYVGKNAPNSMKVLIQNTKDNANAIANSKWSSQMFEELSEYDESSAARI